MRNLNTPAPEKWFAPRRPVSLQVSVLTLGCLLLSIGAGVRAQEKLSPQAPDDVAESASEEVWEDDEDAQEPVSEGDVWVEAPKQDARAPSAWRSTLDVGRLKLRGDDLGQALLGLPGVYVQRAGAEGARQSLSLRGASGQQVKVLLDGVALNPAASGGVDLGLLPPALLGSVEVYRGGSGARFGSGAVGGAVVLTPQLPKDGWGLSLSGALASFGTGKGSAAVAAGGDGFGALVSVTGLRTEGDFRFVDAQGSPLERLNADVQRLGALAVVRWAPSAGSEVRLTGLWVDAERGQPGPAEFQSALDEARAQDRRGTVSLVGKRRDLWVSGGSALDGAFSMGWRASRARYRNPDRLLRSALPYDVIADEDALTGSGTLSLYAESGVLAHMTLEGGWQRLERAELVDVGQRQREVPTRTQAAAALSLEWLLAAESGAPLSVLPALRAQWMSDVEAALLPSLGLRWVVSPQWTLQTNAARAWRAPGFDELYLRNEFVEGDPDLRPEDAWSLDLGVMWSPRPWVRLEAAAFALLVEDLILFLPVSATRLRAQNTGAATSLGVEAAGVVVPWRWLRLEGSYTLTNARLDAPPQDPLPGRPVHKVSAMATVVRPGIEIFVRSTARSTVFLDNFGNLSNGPVVFVDVGAVGELSSTLSVSVTARNVLDERAAVDALQTPLPGASMMVQLQWSPSGAFSSEPPSSGEPDVELSSVGGSP